MKTAILTGQTQEHVQELQQGDFGQGVFLHHKVIAPLTRLKKKAAKAGIEIKVASGFRDFAAQLRIWNAKCLGLRPVLDARGAALDISQLSPEELIFAILRWSALPGASRHHWGTDLDVFDAAACPKDYQVQLVPREAEEGGPFHRFDGWLAEHMAEEGFFRPYARDLGGVSPEWWHLSFSPISETYLKSMSADLVAAALASADMRLKDEVIALLPQIHSRYVTNICPPL